MEHVQLPVVAEDTGRGGARCGHANRFALYRGGVTRYDPDVSLHAVRNRDDLVQRLAQRVAAREPEGAGAVFVTRLAGVALGKRGRRLAVIITVVVAVAGRASAACPGGCFVTVAPCVRTTAARSRTAARRGAGVVTRARAGAGRIAVWKKVGWLWRGGRTAGSAIAASHGRDET